MRRAYLIFSLFMLFAGVAGCASETLRPLRPVRPTATPTSNVAWIVSGEPRVIGFTELAAMAEAEPRALVGETLRVTGALTRLDTAACTDPKGPQPQWGLTDGTWEMLVVGLDSVVRIVPAGTELTVDGVWQLYIGPFGCGKEPPERAVWYMQARRIVAPNPLLSVAPGAAGVQSLPNEGSGPPTLPDAADEGSGFPTATPADGSFPGLDATATPPASSTLTGATRTPTVDFFATSTPSPTASPTLRAGPTATPTATPTPLFPGIPTATPSPTATATSTADDPGGGLPTSTPDPGLETPTPLPTNTPTPDSYPGVTSTPYP